MDAQERRAVYAGMMDVIAADTDATLEVKRVLNGAVLVMSDMHELMASIAASLAHIAHPTIKTDR